MESVELKCVRREGGGGVVRSLGARPPLGNAGGKSIYSIKLSRTSSLTSIRILLKGS